jgi:general stress protein 26
MEEKIQRAKELLTTSRHAAMATVNEDGSPHNTPYKFIYDPALEWIYWGSSPEAMHSKNVTRTRQIFVVVYDREDPGGLYFKCEEAHELSGSELEKALEIHNNLRLTEGKDALPLSYYTGASPQRMYGAKIIKIWINMPQKTKDGNIIKDNKVEVVAKDLI